MIAFRHPELEKYREEIKDHMEQEEDILSYAVFPQVAMKFFEAREQAKNPQVKEAAPVNEAGERVLYVEDLSK